MYAVFLFKEGEWVFLKFVESRDVIDQYGQNHEIYIHKMPPRPS